MQHQQSFQGYIQLPGCLNLRELGGYTTEEQKQTKSRTLLRSDSLHNLPQSSQQQLLDYGIRTIIDLRSPMETGSNEYPLSQRAEIEYYNLPLIEDRSQFESIKDKELIEYNRFFLEQCSSAIKKILETIASSQTAIVIHCAAGKDRTGIIIALLLAIARVPIATIARDYQLSDRYLAPLYNKMRSQAEAEGFAHLLNSHPQTIIDTFSLLEQNYGGIDKYLSSIGVSVAKHISLKTMLVQ